MVDGRGGNDFISGFFGNDTPIGGAGDDTLEGQICHDTLEGGAGNDDLKGNQHNDVFIFADGHGNDTVGDFNVRSRSEFIDLSGVTALSDFVDVQAAATDTVNGLLIDTGGGDSILLNNIRLSMLDADDFLF